MYSSFAFLIVLDLRQPAFPPPFKLAHEQLFGHLIESPTDIQSSLGRCLEIHGDIFSFNVILSLFLADFSPEL
jgi:hypothetical protein